MNELIKQQILDRAIDLFAANGLTKVSIAMIAKSINASRGKVYHHFPEGKSEIVTEILSIFENCVSDSIPNKNEWESENADVNKILFGLFFKFPAEEMERLRKITRIIMAEMYHDEQIAKYATLNLISEREKLITECLNTLAANGKILIFDTESTARCLNRIIMAYALEDALRYPFEKDSATLDEQTERMIHDCTNVIQHMIIKTT